MIAAAALVGGFGAAGSMNGLWATPDARAYGLDGLKLALGLPYGSTTNAHKIQMRASSPFAPPDKDSCEAQASEATAHKSLVAALLQRPRVNATPRMVMADAFARLQAYTAIEPPEPSEPPPVAQGAASVAPVPPIPPAAMKELVAQAGADAVRSTRMTLDAAAANLAQTARASVEVAFKGPPIIAEPEVQILERAFDQAAARLEATQALAARINEGDPSFFVVRADGKKFCGSTQVDADCTLLSPADFARIRSDVAMQVEIATNELRQVQAKLARARLTDS